MFRDLAADGLAPVAGLDAFLAAVDARGLAKAAVTNAPRANAEFMLDCLGRRDWFDVLVIGDECARAKPDPEPYRVAAAALGVAAADCASSQRPRRGKRASRARP